MNCKGLEIPKRHVVAFCLAFAAPVASAQLLATTARQASSGSLKMLVYAQGAEGQLLNFSVTDTAVCMTPSGTPFTCGQAKDVEAKASHIAPMFKLAWQAHQYVELYANVGVLENFTLDVPSTTVAHRLTTDRRGFSYGGGMKASIVPDTMVTPAVALDFSVTRAEQDFNRRSPGLASGTPDSIEQRLELTTYQLAVEFSHLFTTRGWKLEPYGGIKWVRADATLTDLADGDRVRGWKDRVTPFAGLRVPFMTNGAFLAEGSFVGGYQYGAGVEYRFR